MSEIKVGDVVDVAIKRAVVKWVRTQHDIDIVFQAHSGAVLNLRLVTDSDQITVERSTLTAADILPGDVYQDAGNDLWLACGAGRLMLADESANDCERWTNTAQSVDESYGPLTRIFRAEIKDAA